ncbi:MAG: cytochrome c [Thermoanaerobaculia bacterium]
MKSATAAGIALAGLALGAACGSPTSGVPVERLWAEHCVRCHGEDGRGDPRRLAFDPAVDLLRSRLVADRAQGLIFQRIAQGNGGMPAFAYKLERGDIEMLVQYVLERFGGK